MSRVKGFVKEIDFLNILVSIYENLIENFINIYLADDFSFSSSTFA